MKSKSVLYEKLNNIILLLTKKKIKYYLDKLISLSKVNKNKEREKEEYEKNEDESSEEEDEVEEEEEHNKFIRRNIAFKNLTDINDKKNEDNSSQNQQEFKQRTYFNMNSLSSKEEVSSDNCQKILGNSTNINDLLIKGTKKKEKEKKKEKKKEKGKENIDYKINKKDYKENKELKELQEIRRNDNKLSLFFFFDLGNLINKYL